MYLIIYWYQSLIDIVNKVYMYKHDNIVSIDIWNNQKINQNCKYSNTQMFSLIKCKYQILIEWCKSLIIFV
jgi:hypothetical protein